MITKEHMPGDEGNTKTLNPSAPGLMTLHWQKYKFGVAVCRLTASM